MALNVTTAVFGENCNTATASPSLAQWDVGQILKIEGVDLPSAYQVEFSTEYTRNAIPRIGNAAGVAIPNELLQRSAPITAYIVLHEGENDRETEYWITIHITPRTPPETITPDPEELSVIDETIAALQEGVADAEAAATSAEGSASDAADHAADAEAWAVGQRAGEDVPDTDPTYHNNSKYYAGAAEAAAEEAGRHEASWESWAQRAETAAGNAEGSARAAAGSKADAETAAQTATQKATEAGNSAAAAAGSASEARQTVDGAIGAINTARDGALTAIGQAGTTQVNAVNQAGANQVAAVNQAGTTQVTAVEDKGAEVLDSIPQDYSELVDDVADLSRHLNDETTGLDTKAPVILETASGAIASFDDGADGMPIRKIVATIEPVQAAGTPSPDNPLPISGWTGCNIYSTQKNLFDKNLITVLHIGVIENDGSHGTSSTSGYTDPAIQVEANTTYVLSGNLTGYGGATSAGGYRVYYYDSNKNFIGRSANLKSSSTATISAFVTPSNCRFLAIQCQRTNNYPNWDTVQLEQGATVTAYEPFGTTLPIAFTDPSTGDPLTIYGGTLTLNEDGSADVVSSWGKVVLGNLTADQFDSNAVSSSARFTLPINARNGTSSYICPSIASFTLDQTSQYNGYYTSRMQTFLGSQSVINNCYGIDTNKLVVGTKNLQNVSQTDFMTYVTDWEVAYEFATPITYHFSNIGQLYTFLGTNNVWIDTGAITECDYPADTKLYLTARDEEITGNIAPIENGTTASKAYATGDYFFHDTKFCKALTAIASGATFTNGTNYTETTVAAELLAAQN